MYICGFRSKPVKDSVLYKIYSEDYLTKLLKAMNKYNLEYAVIYGVVTNDIPYSVTFFRNESKDMRKFDINYLFAEIELTISKVILSME